MDTSFKVIVATATLVISATVFAAGEPVGYVFQPDTAIRANEMNANFQELADRIAASGSASSPSGKLYIFNTATTVGAGSGRRSMTEACAAVDPEASFCSMERVHAAIAGKGLEFAPDFAGGWLDTTNYAACYGWTNGNSAYEATVMTSSGAISTTPSMSYTTTYSSTSCGGSKSIVCCK